MKLAGVAVTVALSLFSASCATPVSVPADTGEKGAPPAASLTPQTKDSARINWQPGVALRSSTPRLIPIGSVEGYGDSKTGALVIRPLGETTGSSANSEGVAVQTQALGTTPGYKSFDSAVFNDGVLNSNPDDTFEFYTRTVATGNTAPSFDSATCLTHLGGGSTATLADFNAQGVGCAEQHLGNFTTFNFAHVYLDPDTYVSGNPAHLPWALPYTAGSANTPSTATGARNPPDSVLGLWDFGPVGPRGSGTNLVNMWLFFKNGDATQFRWTGSLVGEVYENCTNAEDDDGDTVVNNGCALFAGNTPCFANADCVSGVCTGGTIASRFGAAGGSLTNDVAGVCQGAPNITYGATPLTYSVGVVIANKIPSNSGGAAVTYAVSPAVPSGLSINASSGIVSGTPALVAATASYTVTATNPYGSGTAMLTITVNDAAPYALTYVPNPATYTKNIAITSNVPSNSGGSITAYSVTPALPVGLGLNTTTGVISGTPSALTASATYTITADNTGGSTTANLVILVNDAQPTALTYLANTPTYTVGTTIPNNTPSNTGGVATSYSVSPALPPGLSLDPSSGVMSGTPTAPVAAFRLRPAGKAGLTEYETTAPPLLDAVLLVMAVPMT